MQSSLVVCNDAVKSYGFRKVSAIFCTLDHDTLGVALPLSSTMTVESRPDFAANGRQTPMKIWLWYASKGCYRFWQLYSDFLRRWNPCKKPPVTREILSATNAQRRYHKKISLLMQGPCDAYGWYLNLDRSPCSRRENSTSSHQEHPRLRGEDFKSYIYTRPIPLLAYTLFYFLPGDTENNRLLSLGASPSPKFFHITISLLGQKCNDFVDFYLKFLLCISKNNPFCSSFL